MSTMATELKEMLPSKVRAELEKCVRICNKMPESQLEACEKEFLHNFDCFTRQTDDSTGAVVHYLQRHEFLEALPERIVGVIGGFNKPSGSKIQLLQSFIRPTKLTVAKVFPFKDPDVDSEVIALENRRRFLHETSILQNLDCEFIIQQKISFACLNNAMIFMEFCPYGSLSRHIGKVSLNQAMEWFAQIASAVRFSHEQGIIHWDINPSNVLIRRDLTVALAGFGMSERLTNNHGMVKGKKGTPGFIPPEMEAAKDDEFIDGFKADSYSLGVTLLCLLLGEMPDNDDLLKWSTGHSQHEDAYMTFFLNGLLNVNPDKRSSVTTLIQNVIPLLADNKNNRGSRRSGR